MMTVVTDFGNYKDDEMYIIELTSEKNLDEVEKYL